jgi:hypothetical protein
MLDKVKSYAKNHKDELAELSIVLGVNIIVCTACFALGYKMAENDLDMVGMTTYHNAEGDKIESVTFHQRNGRTVSYEKPKKVN